MTIGFLVTFIWYIVKGHNTALSIGLLVVAVLFLIKKYNFFFLMFISKPQHTLVLKGNQPHIEIICYGILWFILGSQLVFKGQFLNNH